MKLYLDDGHGWFTKGKNSPDFDGNGEFDIRENVVNASVCDKLSALAYCAGDLQPIMIAPGYEDISLGDRVRKANSMYEPGKKEFYLSIHADAFVREDAWGGTFFYYSDRSRIIAEYLTDRMRHYLHDYLPESEWDGIKLRTAKRGNFQVLRDTKMFAALYELDFMTNPEGARRLNQDLWRNAWAIALHDSLTDLKEDWDFLLVDIG